MSHVPDGRHFNTRRMRFKDFDYPTPGYYFVTICQKDRTHLFGQVTNGRMLLTQAGKMINNATIEINRKFSDVKIDAYVVMPNPAHLLIGVNLTEGGEASESLIDVMNWWKTVTTKRYIEGVHNSNWPEFGGRLWQTGYHDKIVRNQEELEAFRYYIQNNSTKWGEDAFNDE